MNKKILGASIAAVFAVALVSSPMMVDAITDLVKTKIKIDDDEYEKIVFKLAEKVPVNGEVFGGYAIFTDGDVIAVTSHQGAYDSEVQDFDGEGTFALCDPAQLAAGLCGPEWHTHLVQPVDHPRCAFKAVGALTFEEPSDETKVKNKKIILEEIEIETDEYTNSITGEEQDFTAGHPTSPDGVAFDLNAAFDTDDNLEAVCIGDVNPIEPGFSILFQDENNIPIPDAVCQVADLSGGFIFYDEGVTDENGHVTLSVDNTFISYYVRCSQDGFVTTGTECVLGGISGQVDVTLTEGINEDCSGTV